MKEFMAEKRGRESFLESHLAGPVQKSPCHAVSVPSARTVRGSVVTRYLIS